MNLSSEITLAMSFRGAKRREIPKITVFRTNFQGFLAPFVARNDICTVNCVTPNLITYPRYLLTWYLGTTVFALFRTLLTQFARFFQTGFKLWRVIMGASNLIQQSGQAQAGG
jgi:hypothetical protein